MMAVKMALGFLAAAAERQTRKGTTNSAVVRRRRSACSISGAARPPVRGRPSLASVRAARQGRVGHGACAPRLRWRPFKTPKPVFEMRSGTPPLPSPPSPDDFTSENAISLNSLSRSLLARQPRLLVHSSVAFPLDTPEFIARTKLFSPLPLAFPLLPFPHKKCLSGVEWGRNFFGQKSG